MLAVAFSAFFDYPCRNRTGESPNMPFRPVAKHGRSRSLGIAAALVAMLPLGSCDFSRPGESAWGSETAWYGAASEPAPVELPPARTAPPPRVLEPAATRRPAGSEEHTS